MLYLQQRLDGPMDSLHVEGRERDHLGEAGEDGERGKEGRADMQRTTQNAVFAAAAARRWRLLHVAEKDEEGAEMTLWQTGNGGELQKDGGRQTTGSTHTMLCLQQPRHPCALPWMSGRGRRGWRKGNPGGSEEWGI